jgi:hypothetical protein
MNPVHARVAVAIVLALAAGGCGAGDDSAGPRPSQEGSPTVSPSVPPSSSPSASPNPDESVTFSPAPPSSKPAPAGRATVRGTVTAGVEAGCLMLTAGGVQYQLVGGDRSLLRAGRSVEVVGEVQPDLATTCQQGVPLLVRSARAV